MIPTVTIADTHYKQSDKVKLGEVMYFYRDVAQDKDIVQQLKMATILTKEGQLIETETSRMYGNTQAKAPELTLTKQKIFSHKKSFFCNGTRRNLWKLSRIWSFHWKFF